MKAREGTREKTRNYGKDEGLKAIIFITNLLLGDKTPLFIMCLFLPYLSSHLDSEVNERGIDSG